MNQKIMKKVVRVRLIFVCLAIESILNMKVYFLNERKYIFKYNGMFANT